MTSAERRHDYRNNFREYTYEVRTAPVMPVQKKNAKPSLSMKEKGKLLLLLAVIGILCCGLIVTSAYAADVKYKINTINQQNAELRGEIDNLTVALRTATSIETIEQKAAAELGMIYPQSEDFVYLAAIQQEQTNLAMIIREQAYN